MASFDRCRRAASIVLVMACFVLAPGIAVAQFKSTRVPTLSISTDSMETPTGVTGVFTCSKTSGQNATESVSIQVTGFTDTGPPGSTYTYTILKAGVPKAAGTSQSHAYTLLASDPDDGAATTWTITIQSKLGQWTGTATSKSAGCVKASNNSGQLV